MTDVVFFDLDGTLVDHRAAVMEAARVARAGWSAELEQQFGELGRHGDHAVVARLQFPHL